MRLRAETRGMITGDDLAAMSADALFVNTSRAALIESGALERALGRCRPGYAALDVFDSEPVAAEDSLVNRPNVVCTPHIGFVTEDELDRQFSDIYDQILAFAAGTPINVVKG